MKITKGKYLGFFFFFFFQDIKKWFNKGINMTLDYIKSIK